MMKLLKKYQVFLESKRDPVVIFVNKITLKEITGTDNTNEIITIMCDKITHYGILED